MYATPVLDLAFVLGTAIIAYRLFIAYRPSITPILWAWWAGQIASTGQSGLALLAIAAILLAGLYAFFLPPRQIIQYGPWAGRDAPMLSLWQFAGLPGSAQVINARGMIVEVRQLDAKLSIYRHPERIFHTLLSRYNPSTPPPLAARPGETRRKPEDLSVEWPYLLRLVPSTLAVGAILCLLLWRFVGHLSLALPVTLLVACAWAVLAMVLATLCVLLQDALYEDQDEDYYPYA